MRSAHIVKVARLSIFSPEVPATVFRMLVGKSGRFGAKHLGDRSDGIPVARSDWYPEEIVDAAEIAYDFHVAPMQAKKESILSREYSQQPPAAGRKVHRHRGLCAGAFRKDAHKADDVRSHRLVRERILSHEPKNFPALADNDWSVKRKPARQFRAESRLGD
jgi:hypothetical protein